MATIFLLIALMILVILHIYFRYSRAGRLISRIPGPKALPILGNLLRFNCSAEETWDDVFNLLDKYYPIYRLQCAHIHGVVVRHPDDLKIILSCRKNIKKSHMVYDNFKAAGHDGLIFSDGEKWHQRRKILNLAFNTNLIRSYVHVANNHTDQLIKNLKSQGNETVQKLLPLFNGLTLRVVCETILGRDETLSTNDEETYRNALDEISEMMFYRAQRPYITDWMLKFLNLGRKLKHATDTVNNIANKIIVERQKHHESNSNQNLFGNFDGAANFGMDKGIVYQETIQLSRISLDYNIINSSDLRIGFHGFDQNMMRDNKKSSVLDSLLLAQKEGLIDAEGVRDEVNTIIAAGYETTGTSISFTLLLFAENKTAQDRARSEVIDVANHSDEPLTYNELQKLDYLERCIKESLRLFPSAPLIGRSLIQDMQLRDYLIPAGTEVGINFYSIHRDPNFWPEPNKFDPDRFLPEATQNRHSHAYLPFSAGLRDCIGRKFAMVEIKAILSRILLNFYIEPVDLISTIKFETGVTLRPTKPVRVKFVRIDRSTP